MEPEEITTEDTSADDLSAMVELTVGWNELVAEYNAALADGTLPDGE